MPAAVKNTELGSLMAIMPFSVSGETVSPRVVQENDAGISHNSCESLSLAVSVEISLSLEVVVSLSVGTSTMLSVSVSMFSADVQSVPSETDPVMEALSDSSFIPVTESDDVDESDSLPETSSAITVIRPQLLQQNNSRKSSNCLLNE